MSTLIVPRSFVPFPINVLLTTNVNSETRTLADPFWEAQQKRDARFVLTAAVHAGILIRPDECSECGIRPAPQVNCTPVAQIHAHHEDYAKPLKVRWLCPTCHSRADRTRRAKQDQRPLGDQFAEFLAAIGEYKLPHKDDPPPDEADPFGDYWIDRAIRSIRFAGFRAPKNNATRQMPLAGLVLSCGHVEVIPASELVALPTHHFCHECTEAERRARAQRRERRRARRVQP